MTRQSVTTIANAFGSVKAVFSVNGFVPAITICNKSTSPCNAAMTKAALAISATFECSYDRELTKIGIIGWMQNINIREHRTGHG
jgi:hypothetical protein